MMFSMNTLPEELYDLIARSTEDSDLPRLALVSRAWYRKQLCSLALTCNSS